MSGYMISEAARLTGFSVSALRFYERERVVIPERTPAGYRTYRDEDIETLRFVDRGKNLGLSLSQITELVALQRDDDCGPVQARMRQLVTDRIGETQRHISELVTFAAQLQQVASRLGSHTPHGSCDDRCGCRSDPPAGGGETQTSVPLVGSQATHIACSLEPQMIGARVDDWKEAVAAARSSQPLPDGMRLDFGREVDVVELARLAADEQDCCSFFTFTLGVRGDGVTLEITGPAEAQPVIHAMFGTAA